MKYEAEGLRIVRDDGRDIGWCNLSHDARRIAALLNAADGVDTATIAALGPGAWRRMWEACRAALSFWERYVDRVSTSESWASAVLVKLRGAVEGDKD